MSRAFGTFVQMMIVERAWRIANPAPFFVENFVSKDRLRGLNRTGFVRLSAYNRYDT